MNASQRITTFASTLVVVATGLAHAQTTPAGRSKLIDDAGLFSKAAAESASRSLASMDLEHRVPIVIEVVASLKGKAIDAVAIDAAKTSGGQGLFVFIAKEEKSLRVLARSPYDARLTEARRGAIRDAFLAGFKTGDYDAGLRKGVEEIATVLKATEPVEPLVTRGHSKLTLAGARKAIAAAEAKATEMKIKANIAVVDDGGHLLAFARMDGARPASAATAQTKATSAATMRLETGPLPGTVVANASDLIVNLGVPAAAAAGGAKVTTLYGGVPIVIDGEVVGAIGVGGGRGDQDAEIAKAGAAAVADGAAGKTPSAK